MKEDYALAIIASREYEAQQEKRPLYLNRLNIERFRTEGITTRELERAIHTEAESLRITADAIEQLIIDLETRGAKELLNRFVQQ